MSGRSGASARGPRKLETTFSFGSRVVRGQAHHVERFGAQEVQSTALQGLACGMLKMLIPGPHFSEALHGAVGVLCRLQVRSFAGCSVGGALHVEGPCLSDPSGFPKTHPKRGMTFGANISALLGP